MTILKKILNWLEQSAIRSRYHDMERYLGQSQNVADLESRIRKWEQSQTRASTFFLS
jgi:hypothetical protein